MKLVIDFDFESYMIEKEINSLTKQLVIAYAANKKAIQPVNMTFSG